MGMFWCLPLALLLLHQTTCTGNGTEVTRAVGRSVTFLLQSLDGEAAAWSFQNDVIVTVKFGNPPETTLFDNKYKKRLTFSKNGTALTISQLRMDDAGTYTAKILGVKTTFTLHVYRELAVPTVTCEAQNCSADGCRYTLRCTTAGSGHGNVSYIWSMGDSPRSEGPMVLVKESPSDESPLTCTVQNPVSSRNATVVSPAALCAGAYSSGKAGIVAASVIGAGVLLAAVIFIIYCKSKGWMIFRLPAAEATNTEAGAEYMTVYAQVGPSRQVHLQGFSDAQQGNAKKMPTPDVETSKTIYFTIQATAQSQTDDEKMGNSKPGCREQDEKIPYLSVSQPDPAAQPRHGSGASMNLL